MAAQRLRELLAASPIDLVPAGADHVCSGGTHSTVADGRRLCWVPALDAGERVALDAEVAAQAVPPLLARRWAITDPAVFWPRWTLAEVIAKVTDVPILVTLLSGPPDPSAAVATDAGMVDHLTWEIDDLVVTAGLLRR
ncbi:hypothetical protein ACQP1U_13500 [Actinomycetota bacterium]